MVRRFSFAAPLASLLVTATLLGQQPPAAGGPQPFEGVFARIRQHAQNDQWKSAPFRDEPLEAWLDEVVGAIAKATENTNLRTPVRLADVKPVEPAGGATLDKALIVGKNIQLPTLTLTNSIVLADGNVELRKAVGCVIVARRAISLDSSGRSVLAAGMYVKVERVDGGPRDPGGSVIVTRGWANLRAPFGSLVTAPAKVLWGSGSGTVLINGRAEDVVRGVRAVTIPHFPVEPLPTSRLGDPLTYERLVRSDGTRPGFVGPDGIEAKDVSGIILRRDGRRYFASLGQPIVDQLGEPVEGLRGWQLSFADDVLALFTHPNGDALVPLDRQP